MNSTIKKRAVQLIQSDWFSTPFVPKTLWIFCDWPPMNRFTKDKTFLSDVLRLKFQLQAFNKLHVKNKSFFAGILLFNICFCCPGCETKIKTNLNSTQDVYYIVFGFQNQTNIWCIKQVRGLKILSRIIGKELLACIDIMKTGGDWPVPRELPFLERLFTPRVWIVAKTMTLKGIFLETITSSSDTCKHSHDNIIVSQ